MKKNVYIRRCDARLDCNRFKSTKKKTSQIMSFFYKQKRIHPRMFHSSLIHPDKKVNDSGSFLKIIEIAYMKVPTVYDDSEIPANELVDRKIYANEGLFKVDRI